ncbi:hypothetical protein [Sandaracinobacter neustonicus]|uniref:hypothetical protein n=1 Tax=Sandaracinobacter neustonicus TaxID=1715348 RepID=UPI0015E421C7|nr:hypothetical protein [Sandaracinobacter neustonicus]
MFFLEVAKSGLHQRVRDQSPLGDGRDLPLCAWPMWRMSSAVAAAAVEFAPEIKVQADE